MELIKDKDFTWSVYRQVHVVPDDDAKVHDMIGKCWCATEIEWINKVMKVTHNSLDGREIAEKLIEEINTHENKLNVFIGSDNEILDAMKVQVPCVEIGKYSIARADEFSVWIEDITTGEGGQFFDEHLIKVIDEFYKKNF